MLKIKMIITLIIMMVSLGSLKAKHNHNHSHDLKNKKIKTDQTNNDLSQESIIILEIDGLVCSFCAYATEKNIAQLDFVDKSKFDGDGVEVLPEQGQAKVALLKNKPISFLKILQSIKKAGYLLKRLNLQQTGTIRQVKKNIFFISNYTGQKILLDKSRLQKIKVRKKQIKIWAYFTAKSIENNLGMAIKKWR